MGSSAIASEEEFIPVCSFTIITIKFLYETGELYIYRINNHFILGNELFRCKHGVINSRFPTMWMGPQRYLS